MSQSQVWWEAISGGTQLDCIYTDFSAAFQSVDHRLLLHKLQRSYSIDGTALAWVGSFLHDRQQRVVLNGQTSSWTPVTSGTPEGSLLSPLLFILFINDLPSHIQSGCFMYADDVKIYREVRSTSDADLLHADLARLVDWSSTWKLQLNAAKCKSFTITLKRMPIVNHYSISGEILDRVTTMRDLGVVLDQKLTFESHIDSIVSKANMALGLMIRSLQAGHRGTKYQPSAIVAAYYANVRSVLENCSVIWSGAAKTHADRIERIQHKFLMWHSAHSGINSQSLSYNSLLSVHSFTSLAARRTQHDLVFLARVFKHKIDSVSLRSCFGLSVPARAVRRRDLFAVPFGRVDTVKNGLFCRIPRKMNEFLHQSGELDIFRDSLYQIKTKAKAYSKVLTATTYPPAR